MSQEKPELGKKAFHCPHCGVLAAMSWSHVDHNHNSTNLLTARCYNCSDLSIWSDDRTDYEKDMRTIRPYGRMLYPLKSTAPLPNEDMPDDVKADYLEAAEIINNSPRGAAALLRLALQKLCKHLGEKGQDINSDIRSLSKKDVLPTSFINILDVIRITGNNAVHPGEMSDEDRNNVTYQLFDFLNLVVEKAITEPKKIQEIVNKMPKNKMDIAAATDQKAKSNG